MGILKGVMEKARKDGSSVIGGESAFLLYDTYGFPLDLTQDIPAELAAEIRAIWLEHKVVAFPGQRMDDDALEQRLFPSPGQVRSQSRPEPDWAQVHRELRRKSVTPVCRFWTRWPA